MKVGQVGKDDGSSISRITLSSTVIGSEYKWKYNTHGINY